MMRPDTQPSLLLPFGYDLLVGTVAILSLVLLVIAIIRLVNGQDLGGATRAVWAAVILFIPTLGPLVFLMATRTPPPVSTPASRESPPSK